MATRHPWSTIEDRLLIIMYPHAHTADIAALLQRPVQNVYYKAFFLKLKKSPEYLASLTSGRIQRGKQHPNMVAAHFRKGHLPHNAGVKGWQAGGGSVQTQFKPGTKPGTTRPIGSYRLNRDGRLEKKTSNRPGPSKMRWEFVHRIVWAQAHGPIPAKHIVRFKPGMATAVLEHITVDRLECITMAENAARNHPINTSPELAKLVQLKGAITRQLNRRIKQQEQITP
jgi:HNH endonuclease